MKDIHIYAIDPYIKNVDDLKDIMMYDLFPEHKFNFIWDKNNPDYLILRPFLFGSPKLLREFYKLFSYDRINIMLGTEMHYPDLNIYDYAIVYDEFNDTSNRTCRIPYISLFFRDNNKLLNEIITAEEAKKILSEKEEFCNFIYSNANAHPFRDKLFYALSEYKPIDSLGKHLQNKKVDNGGCCTENTNWLEESINMKQKYKFTIAAENAMAVGYTTEKIMSSFAANTIPIYFGNPRISDDFNPGAFINCNDYDTLDDIVRYVKYVDETDEEYIRILTTPRQTDIQKEKYDCLLQKYQEFINSIFDSEITDAKRKPEGTWMNHYLNFYFRQIKMEEMIKHPIHTIKEKNIMNTIKFMIKEYIRK